MKYIKRVEPRNARLVKPIVRFRIIGETNSDGDRIVQGLSSGTLYLQKRLRGRKSYIPLQISAGQFSADSVQ